MELVLWLLAFAVGVALIVWGAEASAEHLGRASVRLGVSSFVLALLLAGRGARGAGDGCGIPEAERGRVLRRFYRLEQSRTTPGSGLGLSLAAAVAELHGAHLGLEDAEPGLRVSVGFPEAITIAGCYG